MSCFVSVAAERDTEEGILGFPDWDFEPHEQAMADWIAGIIEKAFDDFPPSMHMDYTEDDIKITFGHGEQFNNVGGIGPAWFFSFKETLTGIQCHNDEALEFADRLRRLADYIEHQIKETQCTAKPAIIQS